MCGIVQISPVHVSLCKYHQFMYLCANITSSCISVQISRAERFRIICIWKILEKSSPNCGLTWKMDGSSRKNLQHFSLPSLLRSSH